LDENKAERKRQYMRSYHQKNKDKINANRKKRYYIHHERETKRQQERRKNPKWKERNRIISRTFYKRHPDRTKKKDAKRRARMHQIICTLTAKEWQQILLLYGHKCIYCGETKNLTQDHVIPVSKGGNHIKENVVPACRSCNCSKGNRDVNTWTWESIL